MTRWVPSELHTHTFHSDGRQSLSELANGAKSLGFECIALTDHNTMTGLNGKETVEKETDIQIIRGMEWTTFYGHMVTIGVNDYVDWRRYSSSELQKGIELVHKQGAAVGMAHPFRIGSPICTGCFWEFDVKDFNMVDYVEVWSGTFAPIKNDNHRAFALWTDLLNQGYRISATSGRDWHSQEPVKDPLSTTFIGLSEVQKDVDEIQIVKAIKNGKLTISIGPLLLLEVKIGDRFYEIGDEIQWSDESLSFLVKISPENVLKQDVFIEEESLNVHINSNLGEVARVKKEPGADTATGKLNGEELTWIRAELYGTVNGIHTLIAFTNPIYITRKSWNESI